MKGFIPVICSVYLRERLNEAVFTAKSGGTAI